MSVVRLLNGEEPSAAANPIATPKGARAANQNEPSQSWAVFFLSQLATIFARPARHRTDSPHHGECSTW